MEKKTVSFMRSLCMGQIEEEIILPFPELSQAVHPGPGPSYRGGQAGARIPAHSGHAAFARAVPPRQRRSGRDGSTAAAIAMVAYAAPAAEIH